MNASTSTRAARWLLTVTAAADQAQQDFAEQPAAVQAGWSGLQPINSLEPQTSPAWL